MWIAVPFSDNLIVHSLVRLNLISFFANSSKNHWCQLIIHFFLEFFFSFPHFSLLPYLILGTSIKWWYTLFFLFLQDFKSCLCIYSFLVESQSLLLKRLNCFVFDLTFFSSSVENFLRNTWYYSTYFFSILHFLLISGWDLTMLFHPCLHKLWIFSTMDSLSLPMVVNHHLGWSS